MLKRTTDPLRLTWKGEQSFSPFGEILKVDIVVQNVILPSLTLNAPNAEESKISSGIRKTIAHPNLGIGISKARIWTLIIFNLREKGTDFAVLKRYGIISGS